MACKCGVEFLQTVGNRGKVSRERMSNTTIFVALIRKTTYLLLPPISASNGKIDAPQQLRYSAEMFNESIF